MISYSLYKVLHLTSVFMIVLSLGAMALQAITGPQRDHPFRKPLAITHGLGMLFSLVAAFGLLARLNISLNGWPPAWVFGKLGIWLALGGMPTVFRRWAYWATNLWLGVILLTATAAFLAIYKPA